LLGGDLITTTLVNSNSYCWECPLFPHFIQCAASERAVIRDRKQTYY
jgi:hypothetical protein